jgi:DNA end-binding protein Ku
MRSAWTGNLRLGRIAIPIGLAPVRDSTAGELSFRLLHRPCSSPVKQLRRCAGCDKEIAGDELVRGYEVAPGQFVLVEDVELDQLSGAADRTVALVCFTEPDAISPLDGGNRYFVLPSESPIGRRPYVLLQTLLAEQRKVALVRLSWRSEWVAAIRPLQGSRALMLERLAFTGELRNAHDVDEQLEAVEVTDEERTVGAELVKRLTVTAGKIPAGTFENNERNRARAIIDAKLAGQEIVTAQQSAPEPLELPSADLTQALKQSIRELRRGAKPKPRAKARAGQS